MTVATERDQISDLWYRAAVPPTQLRPICDALLVATSALGNPRLKDAAEHAGRPSAEAAYGLGLAMLASPGDERGGDVARGWIWVSACMGHGRAASDLARELATAGAAPEPRWPREAIMARVAEWLAPLPWSGAGAAAPPSGGFSSPDRQGMVGHPDGVPDHPDALPDDPLAAEPEPAEADLPGAVTIPRVGDASSREGRELCRLLVNVVGRRLPYRGEIPDPTALARDFLATFPWAVSLARYVEGQFWLLRSAGNRFPRLPPLLLVGPSGCGKTTMCEWLAEKCGFAHTTVAIGGTSDGAGIGAVPRGWITAQTSVPVQVMSEQMVCNPAIILDEVDKGVSDVSNRNGSAMGVLLSMLQPPAQGYRDSCLMAEVDLSMISWMATANTLATLEDAFVKRFLVMPVPAPSADHFGAILPGVVAKEAKRLGVRPDFMPWLTEADRAWLRSYLVKRGSIRDLEVAYRVLAGDRAAQESMAMRRPN